MIDTVALRKKVIDLAIQGKLTQQLPEDGNAEDLYIQIQEERAKLIKEGKIKKEKPLPEISDDEIPFEIPKNWKWVRWGDISEKIQYGYNAPAKNTGRIKMVRISDIQDGKVNWDSVPYCDISEESISDYLLHKNDILFARTGGTVGKSYLVSDIPTDSVYAGYLIRTSYSAMICAQFIKYFMDSELYWKQLQNETIATAQPNCNGNTLSKMIVPLPPVEEQKRIVDVIDTVFVQIKVIDDLQQQYESDCEILKGKIIDAGIRGKLTEQLPEDGNAKDLYAKIQEEKAKLIKDGKIKKEKPLPDISDDEIPFDIPSNWKWVRLGSVLNEVIVPQRDKPKRFDGDIPWCRIEDADGDYMSESHSNQNVSQEIIDEMNLRVFPTGTILSACSGGSIGRILITTTELCTNQTFNGLVCSNGLYNRYLFHILKNSIGKLKKLGSGAAMEYVSQKKVSEMLIPLPPLEEQKRIVVKLEDLIS